MCSWTSGESLVSSLAAPDEHELFDLFSHGGFLVDSPWVRSGHPLQQMGAFGRARTESALQTDFSDEGRPVRGGNLRYELVHNKGKATPRKDQSMSCRAGSVGKDQMMLDHRHEREIGAAIREGKRFCRSWPVGKFPVTGLRRT